MRGMSLSGSGVSRPLATRGEVGVFCLKPDITVWRVLPGGERGNLAFIVDAKWKHLNSSSERLGYSCVGRLPDACIRSPIRVPLH